MTAGFSTGVTAAGRPTVTVVGEIDLTNAGELAAALATVHRS